MLPFRFMGSLGGFAAMVGIVVSYHPTSFGEQATREKENVLFEQDLHGERRAVLCGRPCCYEAYEVAPASRRVTVAGLFLWLTIREKNSGKMHHVWREWITDAEAESGLGPFALLEKHETTLALAYVNRRSMSIRFWEINTAQRVAVDPQSALTYAKSIARVAPFCNTPTNIPVCQLWGKPSDAIGHPQRLRIVWKDNGWWVHLEANDMHFVFQRSQAGSKWRIVGKKAPASKSLPSLNKGGRNPPGGAFLGLRAMGPVASSCRAVCQQCGEDNVEHLAAAKAAERSLHAACDKWSAARAKGEDTSPAAVEIRRSYLEFMKHILKTKHKPNAAWLIPEKIVAAGKLTQQDGSEWSYIVGKGQSGLVVTLWKRDAWRERVPPHGIAASLAIPPELKAEFRVGLASWASPDRQAILRVPYKLRGISGVIEIRRIVSKGAPAAERWEICPDRGIITKNGMWKPFAESPQ